VWGINRIFSDFERARRMGRRGREVVIEQFTWNKVAARTLDVYRQLLPENSLYPDALEQEQNSGSFVRLEAKLRIPTSVESKTANAVLETLKTNLASRGFAPRQRNHSLRIRGDWEKVADALAECRKRLVLAERDT
jgi:hypothetical protein